VNLIHYCVMSEPTDKLEFSIDELVKEVFTSPDLVVGCRGYAPKHGDCSGTWGELNPCGNCKDSQLYTREVIDHIAGVAVSSNYKDNKEYFDLWVRGWTSFFREEVEALDGQTGWRHGNWPNWFWVAIDIHGGVSEKVQKVVWKYLRTWLSNSKINTEIVNKYYPRGLEDPENWGNWGNWEDPEDSEDPEDPEDSEN